MILIGGQVRSFMYLLATLKRITTTIKQKSKLLSKPNTGLGFRIDLSFPVVHIKVETLLQSSSYCCNVLHDSVTTLIDAPFTSGVKRTWHKQNKKNKEMEHYEGNTAESSMKHVCENLYINFNI